MGLDYGFLPEGTLSRPISEAVLIVEKRLGSFSYSRQEPPDFQSFFSSYISFLADCTDLNLLEKALNSISHIACYKLGMGLASVYSAPISLLILLLSSPENHHVKSAIEYMRRVARVIGPRHVLSQLISKYTNDEKLRRGLAVAANQILTDNPDFDFELSDFGDWINPLAQIPSVGPHLVNTITKCVPDYVCHVAVRPPSVPAINLPKPTIDFRTASELPPRPPLPSSARPLKNYRGLKRSTPQIPTTGLFSLTAKQREVREFVDAPFDNDLQSTQEAFTKGIASSEWEDRSAAFNAAKRLLRYATLSEAELHNLISALMEDISSPRAALSLSAIGCLQETFEKMPNEMELEFPRIFPTILKLHQKTAQYFDEAMTACGEAIVNNISSKRFLAVLSTNADSRSAKVQTFIAHYFRVSIEKAITYEERLFPKGSDEACELVKALNKLFNGAVQATREEAKNAAKALSQYYGDNFGDIVRKALDTRDASLFLRMA